MPQLYKVIISDNLDRESVSDRLYKENLSKEEADKIAEDLNNAKSTYLDLDWYKSVPQDYVLWDSSKLYE